MNIRELKNDFWAELDYKKKYYHPTFHILEPVRTAFFAWCVTMTVLFSIILENGVLVSNIREVTNWGLWIVAGALVWKVVTIALSWDWINLVAYLAESIMVWVGYFVAVMIPVGEARFGKLFVVTGLCLLISGAAALMVDAARRAILK